MKCVLCVCVRARARASDMNLHDNLYDAYNGVMCAAWLMCDGEAEGTPITSPTEAADFFEHKRTLDMSKTKHGVTGLRYIKKVLRVY